MFYLAIFPPRTGAHRRTVVSSQAVSVYTVVRELLTENLELPGDQALARVKARGVTRSDAEIRKVVNHTRSELRGRKKSKGRPAAEGATPHSITRELLIADPTLSVDALFAKVKPRCASRNDADIRRAVRRTRNEVLAAGAKLAPAAARATTEPKPATAETELFAAIGLVNKTAQLCGGVAKARAIAEAVRSCGGVDVFLRRLDLVAEILGSETEL